MVERGLDDTPRLVQPTPFNTLLEADLDAGQWHPLASEQRETPTRANGEALAQLLRRPLTLGTSLFLGHHVSPKWHTKETCGN
nr:hypothetical protein [Halomonas socia]